MTTIYHNPRCSKSRQTLALLQENGIEPTVVEYLKTPLDKSALTLLVSQLELPVRELIRTGEEEYKTLGLDNHELSEDELLEAIAAAPKLMQRPVVVNGDKAVIGRPPENVLELIQ